MSINRRISYLFLCVVPFLNFVVVGARTLRPYWFFGVVYCAAMIFGAWSLCGRAVRTGTERERRMCLTGGLLILSTIVVALLWVGLAPPFQATAVENRMRYMVLALGSITVTAGYVMLQTVVREMGEDLLSTMAATFAILAGAAYLVWNCHALGVCVILVRTGRVPAELTAMSEVLDSLLFAACVLTYLATLIFVFSMGRVGLLGHPGKIAFRCRDPDSACLAPGPRIVLPGPAGTFDAVVFEPWIHCWNSSSALDYPLFIGGLVAEARRCRSECSKNDLTK